MPHRVGLEEVTRELVQQRLERVVVVLVDEDHVRVGVLQLSGCADAAEAAAEDEHPRPPTRFLTGRVRRSWASVSHVRRRVDPSTHGSRTYCLLRAKRSSEGDDVPAPACEDAVPVADSDGAPWTERLMFRPVRAVATPTLERAIDGVLASSVPEAVARSLVEHRVVDRVAAEVLR